VHSILSARDIEANEPLCICYVFYRLVSQFMMIRPEILDAKD
jgi:hypothetical protein